MGMVWIYWNVGFDKESFRKKWDAEFERFGGPQMIKLRFIDILVDVLGNPFFQKCWGTFFLHFLANGLPKKPKKIQFKESSTNAEKKRKLIQQYSMFTF